MWEASHPESRCSPTVEGDKVYVSSGFGDLAVLMEIPETILWSLKASETYKGTYGSWGIANHLSLMVKNFIILQEVRKPDYRS
jgi:hypothetical protein